MIYQKKLQLVTPRDGWHSEGLYSYKAPCPHEKWPQKSEHFLFLGQAFENMNNFNNNGIRQIGVLGFCDIFETM